MKVLQINSVCGYGSTGRIATDLYKILEEQGHECLIAYGRGTAPEGINSIRIGTNFDNYMHVLKTRLFDKHGFSSTKATEKFIKKVKEYNPDVIHLHNIHGYYINIELLFNFLKEVNKPVMWTLHDCWALTGHCAYFDYIGCEKWKTGCNSCPQKNEYPKSLFIDNSKYNYVKKKELFNDIKNMHLVTPSNWLSKLVEQSIIKDYSVKVIYNGIDLEIFKPLDSDFKKKNNLNNKFIILGVANIWDKRKGLEYFIELSKQLKSDEIIVLVGLTPDQKKELPQNIIGITRTDNINELVEIYSAADVFINPTLEEVMGLTNVEALACGVPVITFNTGGSIECIDESCGLVVPKGSLDGLIKAVAFLRNNNLDSKDCINRAKLFDKNVRYKEYIDLYTNILKFHNNETK